MGNKALSINGQILTDPNTGKAYKYAGNSGSVTITTNGTHNVDGKINAVVNVVPVGTINITENGTYNVTDKSSAIVNVNSLPNKNLLDNWYFPNAVNQRGFTTSIGDDEYTVDRWFSSRYRTGEKTITLSSDGIVLANSDETSEAYIEIVQYIESTKSAAMVGKEVTISLLTNRGLLQDSIYLSDSSYEGFYSDNFEVYIKAKSNDIGELRLRLVYGNSITVIAVKIEFGSQQTLAHMENGVWVLNETPTQNDMMGECLRYLRVFDSTYWKFSSQISSVPPTSASAYIPNLISDGTYSTITIGEVSYHMVSAEL